MIILDRVEGPMAVLEIDGEHYEFPAAALPEGASEGDVLTLQADPDARAKIEDEARARLERLKKRGPGSGGTLVL